MLAEFLQVLHQIFSPQGVQYLVMGYDIVVDCLDGLELFIYQGNWFLQGVCNLVDLKDDEIEFFLHAPSIS